MGNEQPAREEQPAAAADAPEGAGVVPRHMQAQPGSSAASPAGAGRRRRAKAVFFDRDGKEVDGLRVVGFQSADEFLALLARLN